MLCDTFNVMEGKVTGSMIEVYNALAYFDRNVRFKNIERFLNVLYAYAYRHDDSVDVSTWEWFKCSSIQVHLYPSDLDIEDFERLANTRLVEDGLGAYLKIEAEWEDDYDFRPNKFTKVKCIYVTILDTKLIASGSDLERLMAI